MAGITGGMGTGIVVVDVVVVVVVVVVVGEWLHGGRRRRLRW